MSSADSQGQNRLCLKSLAPRTLEVMRELGSTTSEDLATVIIQRLMRTQPNLTGQETIRRRIYDVINVLSAARVIDKVGKRLMWHGCPAPSAPAANYGTPEDDSRVLAKEKMLRDKVTLLTLYKALLNRNFMRGAAPPDAVSLPAIIVGIREPEKAAVTQPMDGCELEIRADNRNLSFLAPSDILQRLKFSQEFIRNILACSPELARFGTQLLVNEENEEE